MVKFCDHWIYSIKLIYRPKHEIIDRLFIVEALERQQKIRTILESNSA